MCVSYDKNFLMVFLARDPDRDLSGFDLQLENSAHNFLTIRHMVFMFGVCVPYIKVFLVVT